MGDQSYTIGIFIVTCFALGISVVSLFVSLRESRPIYFDNPLSSFRKTRFSIENTYDIPVGEAEDDLHYALSAFFSSLFKNQALSKNQISLNEYVLFSENDVKQLFESICSRDTSNDACKSLNYPSFRSAGLIPSILTNGSSFVLADKFKFEVNPPSFATSVESIKSLLLLSRRPLLFSMPKINAYIENLDTEISTFVTNGAFFVPSDISRPVGSDPMTFMIVGYSDNAIATSGVNRASYERYPRGGFFVRGTRSTSIGHSIAYYEGRTNVANETSRCYQSYFPDTWVPYNKESPSFTPLRSVDSSDQHIYSTISTPMETHESVWMQFEDGSQVTKILCHNCNPQKIIDVDTPFHHLNLNYVPKTVYSTHDICGYYLLPYELIEQAISLIPNGGSPVVAIDLPIKFSKDSFQKSDIDQKKLNMKIEGERYHL